MLTTVSTDDAYVNGHVTFVAARVPGQVSKVLVDDNNRVRKGDVLVELDVGPCEVIVAVRKAAVDTAKADMAAAKADVRGVEDKGKQPTLESPARYGGRSKPDRTPSFEGRRPLTKSEASRQKLAEAEFERAKQLVAERIHKP